MYIGSSTDWVDGLTTKIDLIFLRAGESLFEINASGLQLQSTSKEIRIP